MNKSKIILFIDPRGGKDIMTELDQAMSLARQLGAGMDAVLLTDEELLRAASLPMTREVGQTSAKILPFEVADLQEQFNFLRREIERSLARALGHFQLPWTLAVRSGPLRAQCTSADCPADEWLAIMGSRMRPHSILRLFAAEPGFLTTRKVIVTRAIRGAPSHRRITAVVALGRLSGPALHLCRTIAGWLSSSEDLALFAATDPGGIEKRSRDSLHHLDPRWEPATLLAEIEKTGASAIILVPSLEAPESERARLEMLVERADLPVVILPEGGIPP